MVHVKRDDRVLYITRCRLRRRRLPADYCTRHPAHFFFDTIKDDQPHQLIRLLLWLYLNYNRRRSKTTVVVLVRLSIFHCQTFFLDPDRKPRQLSIPRRSSYKWFETFLLLLSIKSISFLCSISRFIGRQEITHWGGAYLHTHTLNEETPCFFFLSLLFFLLLSLSPSTSLNRLFPVGYATTNNYPPSTEKKMDSGVEPSRFFVVVVWFCCVYRTSRALIDSTCRPIERKLRKTSTTLS